MELTPTNSIDIGGIRCKDEGTEEDGRGGQVTARRTLLCNWAERFNLLNTIVGGASVIGGVYLFAAKPYPDLPSLMPSDWRIKGVGALSVGTNGGAAYKFARVQINYSTLEGVDAQGSVSLDVASSVITLPKSGASLVTDDADAIQIPYTDNPAYSLTVVSYSRVLRNVAGLPLSKILNAAKNPVSSTDMFQGSAPAGTVLFNGGRAFRQTASNNGSGINPSAGGTELSGLWDVQLDFLSRPALAWDFIPIRKSDNTFDFRKVKFRNGTQFLGRSNLNQLFDRNNLFTTFQGL